MKKKCKNCDKKITGFGNFCPNCGKKVEEICKYCWVKKQPYSCKYEKCPGYRLYILTEK